MNRFLFALALLFLPLACRAAPPPGAGKGVHDEDAASPRHRAVAVQGGEANDAQIHVHHTLAVVLEPDQHFVTVQDVIALPPNLRHAGAEFTLHAALEIHASDPPVTPVTPGNGLVRRYMLAADPPEGVLHVSYAGPIEYGLSEQKEEYTRGFRESRGTLRPAGVYLHGESGWIPQFDDGLIRFELGVQAPPEWHLISQGNGTSRGADGRAHWESGGPVEQVYLVGGPLHVARDTAGAVEVLVYLHEPDEALSRKYLDATARYLEMYRQLIGPYPYGKFALVENFWETGFGMPSFTLLGPQVIRFPFILHSSYPHEILHNWWGNSVFVDLESGNWCEGLTAYLADHLIQEQRGQGTEYRRSTLQKYRNYVRAGRDFPLAQFRARHSAATEAVGYGKALMVFHMLRRHVGDDAFRAALADFYRQHRGRRASFDDLRTAFEAVTHADLVPYFEQWVNRTGAPVLSLRDVTVAPVPTGFLLEGALDQVQNEDPFALEVPLRVCTDAGVETHVITTDARTREFTIRLAARPLSVAADPMFDVFRLLDPRETPPSIGQLFGEPQILAVLPVTQAEAAEVEAYRALLDGWQSDEHHIEIVLETQLAKLPDDRAVWIFGRHNRFAADFLAGGAGVSVAESESTFGLAGERVSWTGHSVVVVRRHPRNPEKAVGWLVVDPVDAFPGIGRKLPHYGKYSYLAFEGNEPTNVVKGQWETEGSPLVVTLDPQAIAQRPPAPPDVRHALAELPPVFSEKALMDHVRWLAAPERGGRGLGTPELHAAAEYIAAQLALAGLAPGGDDGTWFQRFTVAEGPAGAAVEAVNVVGLLPGTRADWSDESVILCAHYDHLGRGWPDVHAGDEGRIHPGADDNASGVAVMLELARQLAGAGAGARNLVFIAFSAEECGCWGSKHYVEYPRFPRAGIRAVINLDTVGRLFAGPIAIHGTGTADEWPHIFRGCGFVTGIASQHVPGAVQGSDQESFIARGIPAVQIFTGAHGDYHRPGDTADKVDGAGLVKVATFLQEALTFLLAREEPLTIRIAGAAAPDTSPASRGRRVSFGTVPDFAFQGAGVRVESTVPDSPAARAGILPGDVLVRIDDQDIRDLRSFSEILKTLAPGQQVASTVIRDGTRITVTVVLQAR